MSDVKNRGKQIELLLEELPQVVYLTTADGQFVYVNAAIERLTGVKRGSFLAGQVMIDELCYEESDLQERRAGLKKLGRACATRFRYRIKDKADNISWVEERVKLIKNASGEGALVAGVLSDRTTEVEKEQEIIAERDFIDNLIKSINPDTLLVINEDRDIFKCNEAIEQTFGYSKDEVVGKKTDFLYYDRRVTPGQGSEIHDAIEQFGYHIGEAIGRRKDGEEIALEITSANLKAQKGAVLLIRDITEKKLAQECLKKSEQKYRALFTNMHDGLAIFQPLQDHDDEIKDFEFIECNKAFERLTGLSRDEITGETLCSLFPEVENSKFFKKFTEVADGVEMSTKFDYFLPSVSRYYDIAVFRQVDCSIAALFRDITDFKEEVHSLKSALKKRDYLEYMMGDSAQIKTLYKQIERVAKTDFSVVVYGETGAGKEIVAHALHDFSNRTDKPFIAVDCGAIPANLLESELFGYKRGAFTGADKTRDGSFQMANQGTIFLDEISNLTLDLQKKLLRVIQEREVQKIGSTKREKLDIRIIAATNRNLKKMLEDAEFRKDLYYRLNEFTLTVPPLRERREDIPILVKRFFMEIQSRLDFEQKRISKKAMESLYNYEWPGNVRELKNILKKAIVVSEEVIEPEHLNISVDDEYKITLGSDDTIRLNIDLKEIERIDFKEIKRKYSAEIEKQLIRKTLEMCDGNKSEAARFLQISYMTIMRKIKEYEL